jgi:hypothetical protein
VAASSSRSPDSRFRFRAGQPLNRLLPEAQGSELVDLIVKDLVMLKQAAVF